MARLNWDAPGERFYETGVDRGVLFVGGVGVPWNGLTAVRERPTGGNATPYYIDGLKYINVASYEEFEATLEAYSSPKEFAACDGTVAISNGLFVGQQPRKAFAFSYRTKVGNDIDGLDHGYKLHIVYNALAEPASRNNNTIDNAPDPKKLSWDISTTPPRTSGFRPTAHFVIDSRQTPPKLLAHLEDILYGTDVSHPSLPTATELVDLFNSPGPERRRNLVINPKPLLGSGSVEYRRNHMTDPVPGSYNFANGTGGASSASSITGATDGPLSGVTKYLRRTITTAKSSGSYGWYDYTSAPGPVAIGEKWTVSVYVRSSVACTMRLDVTGRTDNTVQGTGATGLATAVPANEWVRLSTTLTATAAADGIGWWARTEDDLPVSATIDVTAVLVEKTDQVLPYFDGATTPDPLLVPSWTGTPGASASVLTAQAPTGWAVSNSETAVLVTDDDGEPCVELIDPVGGGGGYIYPLNNAATPGVGRWIAFGADVKPLTADQASRMRLYVRTQQGNTIVDEQYSPRGVGWTAGQWTRQVVSVQQTGAADNVDVLIWPYYTPNPGAQFRARRAVVVFADTKEEAEAAVESYFDGDSPSEGGLTRSWAGAPNASESIEQGWI